MRLLSVSLMLLVINQAQSHGGSQGHISNRNPRLTLQSSDPCDRSPCGPNTRCYTTSNGIALCRCLDDFIPDGDTIKGCTRRTHDVVNPCSPNPCGTNAECRTSTRDERPVCTCPIGYEGDPLTNCTRGECIEASDCPAHLTCQKLRCINPCTIPNICGRQAECQTRDHQPICSCGLGKVGDPFIACICIGPLEPCTPSPCGRNTWCKVRNDRAVCSCIDNYIGDPLTGCRPEVVSDIPEVVSDVPEVVSDIPEVVSDVPEVVSDVLECVSDYECNLRMTCSNNRCINRIGVCGVGAFCDVIRGSTQCYQGNPQSRCYPECTANEHCPSYQACYQLQCIDPCEGSCGQGAECKVENHKTICSCPNGYTGHPFESCRPFPKEDMCRDNHCGVGAECTPGFNRFGNNLPICTCPRGFIGNPNISCQRGECEQNDDCRDNQDCYAYICQNPCYTELGSVCGDSAECNVKNHQPVCSCPPGYDGNPLQSCRPHRRTPCQIIGCQ